MDNFIVDDIVIGLGPRYSFTGRDCIGRVVQVYDDGKRIDLELMFSSPDPSGTIGRIFPKLVAEYFRLRDPRTNRQAAAYLNKG